MRIYNLSKSVREEVSAEIEAMAPALRVKLKDLKIAELDDHDLAVIFDASERLYLGRKKRAIYFPLLKDEVVLPNLPSVTVDMGAVKFVVNGANVMRPGIVSFSGEFQKGGLIVVTEVGHQKSIAVGRSTEERRLVEEMKKGAAVESLHYVGDKFWEALKSIQTSNS